MSVQNWLSKNENTDWSGYRREDFRVISLCIFITTKIPTNPTRTEKQAMASAEEWLSWKENCPIKVQGHSGHRQPSQWTVPFQWKVGRAKTHRAVVTQATALWMFGFYGFNNGRGSYAKHPLLFVKSRKKKNPTKKTIKPPTPKQDKQKKAGF